MKTHPESVWIDHFGLDESRDDGSSITEVMSEESEVCEGDIEFVPAAAYVELKKLNERRNQHAKARLEEREMQLADAISTATKVLDELATANAQLQAQTESTLELDKERDELKLRISEAVAVLNCANEGEMHEDTWASVMIAIDTLEGKTC